MTDLGRPKAAGGRRRLLGQRGRARQRSLYGWVVWAAITGPLAVVLLFAIGPKKKVDEIRISN